MGKNDTSPIGLPCSYRLNLIMRTILPRVRSDYFPYHVISRTYISVLEMVI